MWLGSHWSCSVWVKTQWLKHRAPPSHSYARLFLFPAHLLFLCKVLWWRFQNWTINTFILRQEFRLVLETGLISPFYRKCIIWYWNKFRNVGSLKQTFTWSSNTFWTVLYHRPQTITIHGSSWSTRAGKTSGLVLELRTDAEPSAG